MAIVHWSDNYATGITKIDEQHQALFKAVNDLSDSFKGGSAKEQIGKSVDFLVKYTVEHFRDEEGYMEQYGYEGLAAHRSEHRLLLDQVGEFREKYLKAPESVRPMEVARFLGEWLTHHINQVDMKYVAFLKGKGLK